MNKMSSTQTPPEIQVSPSASSSPAPAPPAPAPAPEVADESKAPEPFKLAFVGLDNPHGAGWRELLQNFEQHIEMTAIVPGYGGSTTSLEERFVDLQRFDTVEQLIKNCEFDGALVCLPNDSSPEACTALADAGKHVLAEKPVAGCAADLNALVSAVRKRNVAFQNGYMWRYDDGANRLRNMVRDGRFGELVSVEMTFVTSDVARRGPDHYLFDKAVSRGGFFNWLACHYLDLLFYVTGRAVVGVTARTDVFGKTPVDVEDGGIAILELEGGGVATFMGGYWLPRWAGESHWCIRGSERWVHWIAARPGTSGVLEIHGPQPQWHAMEETFALPPDETRGYGGYRGVRLVGDWLQSARTGQPCRNTPETTQTTLALIDAIYQASDEGRRIECWIGPSNEDDEELDD